MPTNTSKISDVTPLKPAAPESTWRIQKQHQERNIIQQIQHRQQILHKLHLHATKRTNIISPQFSSYLYTAQLYQQKIHDHRMRLTFYP